MSNFMKPEDKYGQCSAEGCENILNDLTSLKDNITIGEIRQFLKERKKEAVLQQEKEEKELLKKLSGKCFKITFSGSTRHIVYLNVVSITLIQYLGTDAELHGDSLTYYKGQIDYKELSEKGDDKYSNYFSYAQVEEFPVEQYEQMKQSFLELRNILDTPEA